MTPIQITKSLIHKLSYCRNIISNLNYKSKIIFRKAINVPKLALDSKEIAYYIVDTQTIVINYKVILLNDKAKLKQIITHEFCHHLANVLSDSKAGHGQTFKDFCSIFGIPDKSTLIVKTKVGEKLR